MPFCNTSLPLEDRVASLVANLTLAEKVVLFADDAFGVPRLNIPDYEWWSEALHGVANSPGVLFNSIVPAATSFPQVTTTACQWCDVVKWARVLACVRRGGFEAYKC